MTFRNNMDVSNRWDMNKKTLKSFLLLAFFALFGFFMQVEKPSFSSDEKDVFVTSSVETASDEALVSTSFLYADDCLHSNSFSIRVVRLSHSDNTNVASARFYSLMNGFRSKVLYSSVRYLVNLGICISSYRYAAGYYIYQLRRLLI